MSEKPTKTLLQQPGILWQRVRDRTRHALECGALFSIPTTYEFIEQDGVRFLVRVLTNLIRKEEARKQQKQAKAIFGKDFNPFLPYEEDLFVIDISDTHVCILNKFNVVEHHLLIITRAFEEQEFLLTFQDFEALWACLAELDGLAFYNAGKRAGASQRHKHLQLVPLPFVPEFSPEGPHVPIEPLLNVANLPDTITTIPSLPFVHAFRKLNLSQIESPLEAAKLTLERYRDLLQAVGMQTDGPMQSDPYNLLITREWMLLVPRSQESFASINVNSLGFAGALLVRDQEQMQLLKALSPMNLLRKVAVSVEPK